MALGLVAEPGSAWAAKESWAWPGAGQVPQPRPPGRSAGGHGSGFVTEQGLRMARRGPLRPPMGALVSLQPGRRDHGTPDTADAFAAPLGGEIGAGGAVAEQTDHQFLRESEGA